VRVPGGIEGLVHKSNLPENRDETPEDALKKYHEGDKIKAVVLEIQPDKQKVAFSIRDYQKKVQQEELSRYMSADETDDSTYTLGDFLKSKAPGNEISSGNHVPPENQDAAESGQPHSGQPDHSSTDVGSTDANPPDVSPPDGSPMDGSPMDVSPNDTGKGGGE